MAWQKALDLLVQHNLPDLDYIKDEPMARHTTFRIGGNAARMAFPRTQEELLTLMQYAAESGVSPLIIGNGSNLLVCDEGIDRPVICTAKALNKISFEGDCILAESGVLLSHLASFAQKNALTGLEFAHGIPGTLGGAICMNAGAYGGEMKDVVQSVTVFDTQSGVHTFSAQEMHFHYRGSLLSEHPEYTVLYVTLQLSHGDAAEIEKTMLDLMARRREKQPYDKPSAGSTFKRPEGYYAGGLIEECGLKGARVGGAEVSEKHAGFVINAGGATAADVIQLIEKIQRTVYEARGVRLEPEIKIIR